MLFLCYIVFSGNDGEGNLYTIEELKKYEFFKDVDINYALDALTGVLSRRYILGFASYLIDNKIEFMMGILDIDNFKLVNDNYGHKIGDGCLKNIAEGLANYIGEDGLVVRYGGDEFIVIYLKSTNYDDVHDYVEKMFNEGNIVRRKINVDNVKFYVTATIGCANFPKDAKTYEDLFLTVDKALYRGKTKGRNCFIIYVESKHKNIEVHRNQETSLVTMFNRITELANNEKNDIDNRIKCILEFIKDSLQISVATFFKTSDKSVINTGSSYSCKIDDECLDIFKKLTDKDGVYMPSGFIQFEKNEKVSSFLKNNKIITFIVSRVYLNKNIIGYLILFEDKITRIWQEKEAALLLYIAKTIEIMYK